MVSQNLLRGVCNIYINQCVGNCAKQIVKNENTQFAGREL
jgi:hypothetical protein